MSEPCRADDIVGISLLAIEQWLTQHGYKAEKNAKITGKAGIAHDIGFYAENPGEGRLIVSQRPLGAQISEEDVIRLFAICLDVGASGILLTAQPNMARNAAKLANLYRIGVIDASNQSMQVSVFQDMLMQNKHLKGPQ
ncbi:MAG: hypothetical protein M1503_09175 [Thaumarchaeota archaeon]|nr:hypothetical protein [Nitrososphaerota archaeon]MCL5318409.1 hypothetical protein [Nitrososphaerota archaeon]